MRYAHLSPDVPRHAVKLLDGLGSTSGTRGEKPAKTHAIAGRQLGDSV